MVLAEEIRYERNQRHPEQQIQVRPQQPRSHLADRVDQVMMIDPHDGHDQKAESIADKDRSDLPQSRKRWLRRRAQFQHHDGDDNRDDAVAECFQAACRHFAMGHGWRKSTTVAALNFLCSKGTKTEN